MKQARMIATEELITWLAGPELGGAGLKVDGKNLGWVNYLQEGLEAEARGLYWRRLLARHVQEKPVKVAAERNMTGKKCSAAGDKSASKHEIRTYWWLADEDESPSMTTMGGDQALDARQIRSLVRDTIVEELGPLLEKLQLPPAPAVAPAPVIRTGSMPTLDASTTARLLESLFGAYQSKSSQQDRIMFALLVNAMATNKQLTDSNVQLLMSQHNVPPGIMEQFMESLKVNRGPLRAVMNAVAQDTESPDGLRTAATVGSHLMNLIPDDDEETEEENDLTEAVTHSDLQF